MIMQKLLGLAFVVLGILSAIPTSDITSAIWFVPFGLYLAITKNDYVSNYDEEQ